MPLPWLPLSPLASIWPRSWERGNTTDRRENLVPKKASIWPRSWERGNDRPGKPFTLPGSMLQFGRVPGNAETARPNNIVFIGTFKRRFEKSRFSFRWPALTHLPTRLQPSVITSLRAVPGRSEPLNLSRGMSYHNRSALPRAIWKPQGTDRNRSPPFYRTKINNQNLVHVVLQKRIQRRLHQGQFPGRKVTLKHGVLNVNPECPRLLEDPAKPLLIAYVIGHQVSVSHLVPSPGLNRREFRNLLQYVPCEKP